MKRIDSVRERFFGKVQVTDGCHLWQGPAHPRTGYGQFAWSHDETKRAHRVAYYFANGHWPTQYVCHRCHNKMCVNPKHIYDGSAADNRRDDIEAGKHQHGESHPMSRLTAADIIEIRRLGAAQTYGIGKVLATQFGVTPTQITRILKRKVWKHI